MGPFSKELDHLMKARKQGGRVHFQWMNYFSQQGPSLLLAYSANSDINSSVEHLTTPHPQSSYFSTVTPAGSSPSIYEPLWGDISGGVVSSWARWLTRPNGMLGAHPGQRFNSLGQNELIFPQRVLLWLPHCDEIPRQKQFKEGRKGLFQLKVPGYSSSSHPHPFGEVRLAGAWESGSQSIQSLWNECSPQGAFPFSRRQEYRRLQWPSLSFSSRGITSIPHHRACSGVLDRC